jgi:hypothetical protein
VKRREAPSNSEQNRQVKRIRLTFLALAGAFLFRATRRPRERTINLDGRDAVGYRGIHVEIQGESWQRWFHGYTQEQCKNILNTRSCLLGNFRWEAGFVHTIPTTEFTHGFVVRIRHVALRFPRQMVRSLMQMVNMKILSAGSCGVGVAISCPRQDSSPNCGNAPRVTLPS